jgi:DNA (cytosine-5)-methyltransferase 1
MEEKLRVISLFSGCGGLDMGFLGGFEFLGKYYDKNNFEIIWANEINQRACETYKFNIGDIACGDIWQQMDNIPHSTDIVLGGFPCQDISINGKMAGVEGSRSGLYRAMVEVVRRTKPKIFIAENVKGLLMKTNRKSLEKVLNDFSELGYSINYQLYYAADFGVPQSRERVFIIGTLPGIKFTPPKPLLKPTEYITAKKALHDLENVPENEKINHIWSRANISPEQGNRKLDANRVGYTIRAECHGNIQWHYNNPRRISMREAARIQSFPDSFLFTSKLRETERQLGNAVPPVLAWHLARAVQYALIK